MPEKEVPKVIESSNATYNIIKTLGAGGTSVVYLANDGHRDVALKILGEEVDPQFKERYVEILKNEFEVLSKLRHPNIAGVYDFEYCPKLEKYFFTTEYISGMDIYNYSAQLDFKAKEELFVQLLLALDHVHRSGIIHCDIKCGNALVTQVKNTPVVKLVDFGFATRKLAVGGSVVGTPHYLAPELLVGGWDIDHRVDIYAMGIVFYRLLHRAYPCSSGEVSDLIKWHRSQKNVQFSEEFPDYAKHLILRMIETMPPDRLPSCAKAIEFINFRTEGRYKKVAEKITGLQFKEGPLIGRNDFVAILQGVLSDVKAKRSPANYGAILYGAQGIGKSRLLRELKYRAELEEIPLKEFVCLDGRDNLNEFFECLREIEKPSKASSSDASDRKLASIQWINQLIERYKQSGLIIMIDDVQFAGSDFLGFINILEERLRVNRAEGTLPIYLAAGCRPPSELSPSVLKWFEASQLLKKEVPSLGGDNVKEYIEKVGVPSTDKVLESAVQFSGGVPLLLEAYCQHALSVGTEAKLPETLAQSYLERAKAFSPSARKCLEFLSLSKRGLTVDEMAELLALDKTLLLEDVQKLVSAGFVNIVYPSVVVNLSNKAIAQAIKSGMENISLKEVCEKLGVLAEKRPQKVLSEIAEYFIGAETKEKAFYYSNAAAKHFEEKFNNSEALKFLTYALKFASGDDPKRELERSASRVEIMMGRYKDAIPKLEKLIKGGDMALENYRLLGMAYTKIHDFAHAKSSYEDGLAKMSDESAIIDLVRFKNSLGNVCFYVKDLDGSEKYFTEAIADATEGLLLNNNLGLILSAKGDYDQAIKFYDGRKRFLAAKKNKRALALCFADCGYIHMTNNHLKEAVDEFEQSYKLSLEMGDLYNILVVLGNMVRCYQQMAEFSKALEHALKSLELEGSVGSIEEIAQNHLTLGILYETVGISDMAKEHIGMATDRFTATGNKEMIGWCKLSLSYVYKDMDKFDEAKKELDAIGADASKDLDSWKKYAMGDLYAEYGKLKEAERELNAIQASPSADFEVRKKLVELKAGMFKEKEKLGEWRGLINKCHDNPELLWEAYSAFGDFLKKEGRDEDSQDAYKLAFETIEGVASNLTEAYRDSYKCQRFRLRIILKFEPEYGAVSMSQGVPKGAETIETKTSAIR